MKSISLEHAGASYDVLIGDMDDALERLAEVSRGHRVPLITDARVHSLHGDRFADIALPRPLLVPEGEAAKNWPVLEGLVHQLAEQGVKRGTPVIALGGGSVGDVAGLAASLFKRGCPIIHVPTTLLAQADSAIGGKTAIDAAGQKNLVGTFHHPALVVIDPAFLDTLDERQRRAGYAEVVKYGLIDDLSFFEWCEAHGRPLIAGDRDARFRAIEYSVRTKARFVSADPDDTGGTRALLNFGHTFGHAIEALAGHDLLHGEAVAVGMTLAFGFSATIGLCSNEEVRRVRSHLVEMGLPTSIAEAGVGPKRGDLVDLMGTDKKAGADGLTLVLARGIGQPQLVRGVEPSRVADFLNSAD